MIPFGWGWSGSCAVSACWSRIRLKGLQKFLVIIAGLERREFYAVNIIPSNRIQSTNWRTSWEPQRARWLGTWRNIRTCSTWKWPWTSKLQLIGMVGMFYWARTQSSSCSLQENSGYLSGEFRLFITHPAEIFMDLWQTLISSSLCAHRIFSLARNDLSSPSLQVKYLFCTQGGDFV